MLKVATIIVAGTYDEAMKIASEDEEIYGVAVQIVSELHMPPPGFPAAPFVDVVLSGPREKVIWAAADGWGMSGDELSEAIIP